jgi:hypothetical protein
MLWRLFGSDRLDTLAREYPGDEAWNRFAAAYGVGDGDVRAVADVVTSPRWFDCKVPALDGYTPASILRRHRDGLNIVRSALMRVP